MNSSHVQEKLVDAGIECIKDERYVGLVQMLETICVSQKDDESLEELQEIKRRAPFDLNKFQTMYFRSKSMDGRRGFVFKGGKGFRGRLKAEDVSQLYSKYVIKPLNRVAVRVFGILSRSRSISLSRMIDSKTELTRQRENPKVEVIMDG